MPKITQEDIQAYFKGDRSILETKIDNASLEEAIYNLKEIETFIQTHSHFSRAKQYGTYGAEKGRNTGKNIGITLGIYQLVDEMIALPAYVQTNYVLNKEMDTSQNTKFTLAVGTSMLLTIAMTLYVIPAIGGKLGEATGFAAGSIYGLFSSDSINKDELTYLHVKTKHKVEELESPHFDHESKQNRK